ncbi:PGF-pre-PGF domain-containing protein [Methanovulcanius yangii]|uniref:PGF-pre-PGF domain-containing protein n=1 Tax=Methanovulcanius yangii TaxID=1789227 RepID=UPI0029CA4853|nr:PGF-pre-PGF domain-containing protein [Methanovulcanius yangii]
MKPLPILSALTIVLLFLLVLPASAGYVWENVTVDSSGHVGEYSSLAFNGSYPAISYLDWDTRHLKYAWKDADGWHNETVDSNDSVGQCTSLAFDGDGNPAISYYDFAVGNRDLKYAWQDGGVWQITTVDAVGEVGSYNSLAFNGDYPAISYHDAVNDTLKYAWQDAGGWHTTVVDSSGQVGSDTSLAFNAGYPAISYYDYISNYDLKYAWQDGDGWHNETVDTAGNVGMDTSLAFNGGYPAISYKGDNHLKYAWQDGDGWHNETVDSEATASDTSLAFSGNTPAISYFDGSFGNRNLKFAWKDGNDDWHIGIVDDAEEVGTYSSLAFNGSCPAISYYDGDPANQDLKYATGTPAGNVTVTSTPTGAAVWLDGVDTGFTTPATLADVATGTHNVTVTHAGYFPGVNNTVEVIFDETTDVAFTLAPVQTPTTPVPTPTPDTGDGDDPMDDTAIAVAKGLAGGGNATFSLDPSLSPIYQIQVTVKGTVETLLVTARTTGSPGSGIPAPDGIVYQFIEVTLAKTTDDQIDHTEMMFTVPLTWLEANGYAPANIILSRWHDGEWQQLPTTFVKEEGGKASFTATSPGFSLFAIVAVDEPVTIAVDEEEEIPVPTEEPTAEMTATDTTVSPTAVTTGTEEETPAAEETAAPEPTDTPQSPLFVFAPVAALGALLVLGKKR